ncbi:glutathione S-transferase 2-like [Melitaea cinxia]|uniref:glutathione S-transferase 2-like n=1 Tax=Melitaea cinxia TaxID=113334 RepID=UPI001E272C05|nr:glutathione S-transferase 2-like [Melitaea cinxia]
MPKVVFYYFNVKSLGEGARMMLTYADQEFEDRRVSDEEWPALKPSMPFGQMPVMVIDGKQYAQSFAISRYLGRKYGLSGKDIEEDFEIDQNMDHVKDIYATAAIVQYETDEVVREKKHKDFTKNVYPAMLDKLDEIIKKNNGHIALGKITWADFMFTGVLDYIKKMLRMPDLEKKYPSYQQVIDNVYAIPKIAAYKKNAPETEF